MKKIKEMSKKDKIKYFAILSLLILLIIGTAFALIRLITKQDTVNLVESGCFDVSMANQENAINLEKAFPLSDEQGRNLTPFTFTLTNNCNVTAKYTVNLEVLSGSTLNTNYVATLVNNGTIKTLGTLPKVDTTINDSLESRTIETGILPANASLDFSVSIWVDEDVTLNDDAMNKVLKSKVIVVSTPTNIKTKTEEIIAQLDTTGKCPTVNEDGTVTVTDVEKGDGYLCSAPDDYGTSYYYRGNVVNNYVKLGTWSNDAHDIVYGFSTSSQGEDTGNNYLSYSSLEECQNDNGDYINNCTAVSRKGKPMYWRIVRINGDGTVRLVYDGTEIYTNNDKYYERGISSPTTRKDVLEGSFNIGFLYDNRGVGYMYGDIDGIIESTQTNNITLNNDEEYYIAKDYDYNQTIGYFDLSKSSKIKGSAIDSSYVGYYTFGDSSLTSYGIIKKIVNVESSSNGPIITYKNIVKGTNSIANTQTNQIDSLAKIQIDNWYQTNILSSSIEQYISDEIFCANRSISGSKPNEYFTNLGYGPEPTLYGWGENIIPIINNNDDNSNLASTVNRLTCPQQNDAFTVSDTKKGNGALTYPAAMLTMDEAILAGSYFGKENSSFYLYTKNSNLLMTPIGYDETAIISGLGVDGSSKFNTYLDIGSSIRPVINVKASTLLYGDGTASNPYRPIE